MANGPASATNHTGHSHVRPPMLHQPNSVRSLHGLMIIYLDHSTPDWFFWGARWLSSRSPDRACAIPPSSLARPMVVCWFQADVEFPRQATLESTPAAARTGTCNTKQVLRPTDTCVRVHTRPLFISLHISSTCLSDIHHAL